MTSQDPKTKRAQQKSAPQSSRPPHALPDGKGGKRTLISRPAPEGPFWKTKTLAEMSKKEWESLCDGCGKCCLIGLEDEVIAEIYLTDVACKMLDAKTCQCKDYANRKTHVPDCVKLTPKRVEKLKWLPRTCAYRLVHEGRDLFWWHPLVSGDPNTVHEANVSVRDKVRSELTVKERNLTRRITQWPEPLKTKPKRAKKS